MYEVCLTHGPLLTKRPPSRTGFLLLVPNLVRSALETPKDACDSACNLGGLYICVFNDVWSFMLQISPARPAPPSQAKPAGNRIHKAGEYHTAEALVKLLLRPWNTSKLIHSFAPVMILFDLSVTCWAKTRYNRSLRYDCDADMGLFMTSHAKKVAV